jgi:hypothetical protein
MPIRLRVASLSLQVEVASDPDDVTARIGAFVGGLTRQASRDSSHSERGCKSVQTGWAVLSHTPYTYQAYATPLGSRSRYLPRSASFRWLPLNATG